MQSNFLGCLRKTGYFPNRWFYFDLHKFLLMVDIVQSNFDLNGYPNV